MPLQITNTKTLQGDLTYGLKKEDEIKPLLEAYFGIKQLAKTTRYCSWDWINEAEKIIFELKSRRCPKAQYPDTMIGFNKIQKFINKIQCGYRAILLFKFTDGLYFFELTTENFNQSWVRKGGRFDRGRIESNQYYFVPCNLLTKLDPISEEEVEILVENEFIVVENDKIALEEGF